MLNKDGQVLNLKYNFLELSEKELQVTNGGSLTIAGFLLGAKAAAVYAPAVAKATGLTVAQASKILLTGTTSVGVAGDSAAIVTIINRILR